MLQKAVKPNSAHEGQKLPAAANGGRAGGSAAGLWSRALPPLPLQAKLTVNQPGDIYEQEADRVAAQVMRMPDPAAGGARRCACGGVADATGECPACRAKRLGLQRKSDAAGGVAALPSVHETLRAPGRPLDGGARAFMESRFGQDFSKVRVHTGSGAAASARAVGAQAYTVGQNVVFGEGRYAPGTDAGKRLIAHELAHVVQQRNNSNSVQRFVACETSEDCPQRTSGESTRSQQSPMQIGQVTGTTAGTLIWDFAIDSSAPKGNLLADLIWINYLSQMIAHPEARWEILGFTDCQGVEANNTQLRLERANAIRSALPASVQGRVSTAAGASIGDCIASNDTEGNRSLNRSVLIRQIAEQHNMPDEAVRVARPRFICGPDVTAAVERAIDFTRTAFGGWTAYEKTSACDSLDSFVTGGFAWDIVELHNQSWILRYRPGCATVGATPACGSSVQVGDDCYYAGSVNYVIFGVMCKLCYDHFYRSLASPRFLRFTRRRMLELVDYYKGSGLTGLSTPSANFVPSQQWSEAGYSGWRAGASQPPGDRSNCRPICGRTSSDPYHVNWYPHMPI